MGTTTEQMHTKVTADASQARSEMGGFKAAIDAVGTAGERMGAAVAAGLDGLKRGFEGVQNAAGALQQAMGYLQAGVQAAADVEQFERLQRALPTSAINELERASRGLISQADLLRLGVRGMTGDFALNEQQMGKVVEAAVALSQRGYGTATEMTQKLLESTVKFEQEGLAQLGIAFKKTGDRATDLNALLGKYDELIADSGPTDARAASIAQMQRNIEKATMAIKEMMAAVTELVAEGINGLSAIGQWIREAPSDIKAKYQTDDWVSATLPRSLQVERWQMEQRRRGAMGAPAGAALTDEQYAESYGLDMSSDDRPFSQRWAPPPRVSPKGRAGGGDGAGYSVGAAEAGERTVYGRNTVASLTAQAGGAAGSTGGLQSLLAGPRGKGGGRSVYDAFGLDDKAMDASMRSLRARADEYKAIVDGMKMAGETMAQAISSAFTAGIQAAIDGSENAGMAALRASASVLKAKSIESAGLAVYHGAMAIGQYAFGNVADGAMHTAAAAQFGTAALATGAGAALLGSAVGGAGGGGGRGGQQASAAGGGFARPATNGQAAGGGINLTVNFGAGFVGKTDEVAQAIGQAVVDANRKGVRMTATTTFKG